jgi:CRP/FNR family transcriptional regulator, cyclic AMP receptor protein
MPSTNLPPPGAKSTQRAPRQETPAATASQDDPFAIVRRCPLLEGVSAESIARFFSRAYWRNYTAGQVVVDLSDETNEVFFVSEGALRVVIRTSFGYEAILNDLSIGDFFGELAAIDGLPRSASVSALRRSRLCVVPASSFMDLIISSPHMVRRLLRLLSTRLRVKDERLIEFGALTVRQRLIAQLLRLSRERGNGERVLSPPPARQVLAAYIGARRETVSRELGDLSRAGLLTISSRSIVVHSPERMKAEVEPRSVDTTLSPGTINSKMRRRRAP